MYFKTDFRSFSLGVDLEQPVQRDLVAVVESDLNRTNERTNERRKERKNGGYDGKVRFERELAGRVKLSPVLSLSPLSLLPRSSK